MEKVALVEFVKKIELFKDLDPDSLAVIAQNLEEKRYESGEMLFSENNPREEIVFIKTGRVLLFKKTPYGEEKTMSFFGAYDFLGEGAIIDDTPHFASARVMEDTVVHYINKENLIKIFESNGTIAMSVYSYVAKVISRRMRQANSRVLNTNVQYESGRSRTEHDLLGYRDVPHEYYYGIQTLRALENFNISGVTLKFFPVLIEAFASV
ncbi:MAG: cyclic nucleotide-binding domain-containing protein, partial [Deltaproteobacteria bacterium]|nr:cyclic nucleotide-binding domain-containing protein [Deltaproteobacteria bacterium]